jgi:hypothetical protein
VEAEFYFDKEKIEEMKQLVSAIPDVKRFPIGMPERSARAGR